MTRQVLIRVLVAVTGFAVAGLTLAGCDALGNRASLDGTAWRLVAWPVSALDPQDFTITAEFEDGRVGGTSAVNSYGGEYRTGSGGDFSVGEIAQTLMAGPEEDMRAEAAYLELLRTAESYRLDDTRLTLYDSEGNESLIFEAVDQ